MRKLKNMNEPVQIIITANELLKLSEDELSMYICARLRANRVPVVGMFKFKGVEYGKIVSYDDIETGDKVILWRDS